MIKLNKKSKHSNSPFYILKKEEKRERKKEKKRIDISISE